MKILYGVQGTGQGHVTRAQVLGPALEKAGAKVDFLFSGRPDHDKYYGMERFGDFKVRRGLTFHFSHGKINPLRTVFNNRASRLLMDMCRLNVKSYDLVITDYEPITAWAAKTKGVPSLGIGNQYAFRYNIPKAGFNKLNLWAMRSLAPAKTELGVHWHHFEEPILPPIFEPPLEKSPVDPSKILVYLNFENLKTVSVLLRNFPEKNFFIYSSDVKKPRDEDHLKFRPTSSEFKSDLADCSGIICGAGFGLVTEALYLGKKILLKPMGGQPEQVSNALALQQLGMGDVMNNLDQKAVSAWFAKAARGRIFYPDTATATAQWVMSGESATDNLVRSLWNQVRKHPAREQEMFNLQAA